MGDKAEIFAEMSIALASTKVLFFLLQLHMPFGCYGNLKFP